MDKSWIILIAGVLFLVWSVFIYRSMRSFVREKFGNLWLKNWGNKVYFWQSLLFTSMAGTALVLFLLKWGNVLSF
ncbi:MAG: hypothetical protein AAF466_05410 [Bacteroidota bacterium]